MSALSHASIEITVSGPVRAASGAREFVWALVGNVALHASLIAVASIIPVNSAAWMMSAVPHHPPSGDNTIQLSIAFLDAAASSPVEKSEAASAILVQASPVTTKGSSALAPRKVDVVPVGTLAALPDATAKAESLEEAAATSKIAQPKATRQETAHFQPDVVDSFSENPRTVISKLPTESASAPQKATSTMSAADSRGSPDVLPSEVHSPFPPYPPELLARRIQATVVLRLKIAADGTIAEATVHKTSGYEAMDQAALTGVKSWKFRPALKNGKHVETVVRKPFTFEIRE